MLAHTSFAHAAPLPSALPSVPPPFISQSEALIAEKGPSAEMEAPAAAQQSMLYTVSLDTSAPHSVVYIGVPPVTDDWSCNNGCWCVLTGPVHINQALPVVLELV